MSVPTPIRKGMILAAGMGTRLLPVTEKQPKPLVPVLNLPNILHSLNVLRRAGVRDVIINLHHLPDSIEAFLKDGSRWKMRISYSREPLLLGTGGGLKKAESFFQGESLVLVNCDFVSNVDLKPIFERHRSRDALATMVLFENPKIQPFYSKVGCDDGERLCSLPRYEVRPPLRTGIFTGIHVLAPSCFEHLEEVPCGINEVLYPLLMKNSPGRVYVDFPSDIYWYDTGERLTLWSASMKLLERLNHGDPVLRDFLETFGEYEERQPGVWCPKGEKLPTAVTLVPPLVVGRDCRVGSGTRLGPYTLLGDCSEVGQQATVARFVALGAARIPGNRASEGALQFEHLTLPASKPA